MILPFGHVVWEYDQFWRAMLSTVSPADRRRHHVPARPPEADEVTIRDALSEARTLAEGSPADEPAAMLFAFARRPAAFTALEPATMPAALAVAQARERNYAARHALLADFDELQVMAEAVLLSGWSWPVTREAVARRTIKVSGPRNGPVRRGGHSRRRTVTPRTGRRPSRAW